MDDHKKKVSIGAAVLISSIIGAGMVFSAVNTAICMALFLSTLLVWYLLPLRTAAAATVTIAGLYSLMGAVLSYQVVHKEPSGIKHVATEERSVLLAHQDDFGQHAKELLEDFKAGKLGADITPYGEFNGSERDRLGRMVLSGFFYLGSYDLISGWDTISHDDYIQTDRHVMLMSPSRIQELSKKNKEAVARLFGIEESELSKEDLEKGLEARPYSGIYVLGCLVSKDGEVHGVQALPHGFAFDARNVPGSEPLMEICETFAVKDEDLPDLPSVAEIRKQLLKDPDLH